MQKLFVLLDLFSPKFGKQVKCHDYRTGTSKTLIGFINDRYAIFTSVIGK